MRRGLIPGSTGAVHPLRRYGDPVLHTAGRPVAAADRSSLPALVEDLYATMYAAYGVGLAACQIGVPLRVFVYDCPDDEDRRHRGHVVNPRLTRLDGVTVRGPEGCLSLPGLEAPTPRADVAVIEGEDLTGAPVRVEGSGYFARCLQHEYDHLEGRVYVDRLTGWSRHRTLRAARKL
ncbi:peptide deformylase [Streptomyces spirodelae]|uniref:Peptide deformylase n=1 Tax=Streptomyces spirodelae TaxID=2812904 RepID=A0ABS3WME6_9ACTN|nr:peptide deformylase [Streptomyces spirodelae]MBO8184298.1 peptide deformylase [Streptomyces spirodelae]